MSMRIRIIRGAVLLLSLAAACAGCTLVPTQGPIERVEQTSSVNRQPRVDVAALPPAQDASPELILEGFLAACENSANGYDVARQYLTPRAAKDWRPENGATIYATSSESKVITADGSAILRLVVTGQLSPAGRYSPAPEQAKSHDFVLTRVDGQWRIDNPGDGVLLSQLRFHRAFRPAEVYYLRPDGRGLIAEQVFVPSHDQSPDSLVRALIAGPSQWLSPAVDTAFPPMTTSSGSWRDSSGLVHVNLSEQVEALQPDQRVQMAAQLLFSLRAAGWGERLTVNVAGRPLSIRGVDSTGVLRSADLAPLAPVAPKAARDIFAVRDGTLVRVDDVAPGRVEALRVQPTMPAEQGIGEIASWDNGQLFAIADDRRTMIQLLSADGTFSEIISAPGVFGLHFDAVGDLWWVANVDGKVTIWRRTLTGLIAAFEQPQLAARSVSAIEISPDRGRIALIVTDPQGNQEFGYLRVRWAEQVVVDGWQPLPLIEDDKPMGVLRDLGWESAARMYVLGAVSAGQRLDVKAVDLDAATISSIGPMFDAAPLRMSVSLGGQRPMILTEQGRLLRHEDQYRWVPLAERLSTVEYSS